jgi:hypothetical protein
MITDLREEAANRICKTYPTTLDGWERIHRDPEEPIPNGLDSDALDTMIDLWNLARVSYEGHLYSVLPAIYLECAMFDVTLLLDVTSGDLTEPLSIDLVKAIVSGKEKLTRLHRDMVFSWLCTSYISPTNCKRPDECRLARLVLAQNRFMVDVDLHLFGQARWYDALTKGLCNICKAGAKRAYDEGSSKYWEHLPVAFGLGNWTKLKERMEKEAGIFMDDDT